MRDYGTGTIYERTTSKGRTYFEGSLTMGRTPEGKKVRRWFRGETKGAVRAKLKEAQAEAATLQWVAPSRITVDAYMTRWLEDGAKPSLREKTYTDYRQVIRKHIAPRMGGTRLQQVTPAQIQGLLSSMERDHQEGRVKGGAPIRQKTYRIIHAAFGQAVRWRLLRDNPASGVVEPRTPPRPMDVWKPDTAIRFLEAAKDDRYHALYAVLLGCGLRVGEALGLGWPEVNLEGKTLTVRRQLSEVSGRVSLTEPKTKAAMRTVDLPDFVVTALRQHQHRMEKETHLVTDFNLVFVDTHGKPVRKSNLRQRSFDLLLKTAGIPRIRLHDLRHACTSLHLSLGTPLLVIQRMLGHSRPSVTLDVYSHLMPTMGREAADKMDTLLTPKPKA